MIDHIQYRYIAKFIENQFQPVDSRLQGYEVKFNARCDLKKSMEAGQSGDINIVV